MLFVTILIPVYKEKPDRYEEMSLHQCLKILGNHNITLVCPETLNVNYYKNYATKYSSEIFIERFKDEYFKNISSYNKLLLSFEFYKRFERNDYILIYQLDTWVFNDELEFWCKKGYDFIGAPLIGDYREYKFMPEWNIGNGGFSLRKVNSFIKTFDHKGPLFSIKEIIKRYDIFAPQKLYKRIPLLLLMIFGFRNNFNYLVNNWHFNEDNFWTMVLSKTKLEMKLPADKDAISFSFERFPSKLFEMNQNKLPFGCHAWQKYEYNDFWIRYIK